jgi:hypothetical protein
LSVRPFGTRQQQLAVARHSAAASVWTADRTYGIILQKQEINYQLLEIWSLAKIQGFTEQAKL